jgi:hypothetical protein
VKSPFQPGVYYAELICPEKHVFLGGFYYCEDRRHLATFVALVYTQWEEMCAKGIAKPECETCKSAPFEVVTARTEFRTMEEAMPTLREMHCTGHITGPAWNADNN